MFEEYVQPLVDFVRAAPGLGRADRVRARLRGVARLHFAAGPRLGRAGADRHASIQAGGLNFWPIWVAGSIGAALGDWLSYWIGRSSNTRCSTSGRCRSHPQLIPKGEAFIKKWGALGIFIGRFSGPLRASVPLVAGIFEMPFWRFQIANFVSAFVWAATLLLLGDVVSKALQADLE